MRPSAGSAFGSRDTDAPRPTHKIEASSLSGPPQLCALPPGPVRLYLSVFKCGRGPYATAPTEALRQPRVLPHMVDLATVCVCLSDTRRRMDETDPSLESFWSNGTFMVPVHSHCFHALAACFGLVPVEFPVDENGKDARVTMPGKPRPGVESVIIERMEVTDEALCVRPLHGQWPEWLDAPHFKTRESPLSRSMSLRSPSATTATSSGEGRPRAGSKGMDGFDNKSKGMEDFNTKCKGADEGDIQSSSQGLNSVPQVDAEHRLLTFQRFDTRGVTYKREVMRQLVRIDQRTFPPLPLALRPPLPPVLPSPPSFLLLRRGQPRIHRSSAQLNRLMRHATSIAVSSSAASFTVENALDSATSQLACEPRSIAAGCWHLPTLLNAQECGRLLHVARSLDFKSVANEYPDKYRSSTRMMWWSPRLAADLWPRMHAWVTRVYADAAPHGFLSGGTWAPCGINPYFRLSRYGVGQHFAEHTDVRFCDASSTSCCTVLSVVVVLDAESYEGGATVFRVKASDLAAADAREVPKVREADVYGSRPTVERKTLRQGPGESKSEAQVEVHVRPDTGGALVFPHHVPHRGDLVLRGCKIILRADILFRRVALPPFLTLEREALHLLQSPAYYRTLHLFRESVYATAANLPATATELFLKAVACEQSYVPPLTDSSPLIPSSQSPSPSPSTSTSYLGASTILACDTMVDSSALRSGCAFGDSVAASEVGMQTKRRYGSAGPCLESSICRGIPATTRVEIEPAAPKKLVLLESLPSPLFAHMLFFLGARDLDALECCSRATALNMYECDVRVRQWCAASGALDTARVVQEHLLTKLRVSAATEREQYASLGVAPIASVAAALCRSRMWRRYKRVRMRVADPTSETCHLVDVGTHAVHVYRGMPPPTRAPPSETKLGSRAVRSTSRVSEPDVVHAKSPVQLRCIHTCHPNLEYEGDPREIDFAWAARPTAYYRSRLLYDPDDAPILHGVEALHELRRVEGEDGKEAYATSLAKTRVWLDAQHMLDHKAMAELASIIPWHDIPYRAPSAARAPRGPTESKILPSERKAQLPPMHLLKRARLLSCLVREASAPYILLTSCLPSNDLSELRHALELEAREQMKSRGCVRTVHPAVLIALAHLWYRRERSGEGAGASFGAGSRRHLSRSTQDREPRAFSSTLNHDGSSGSSSSKRLAPSVFDSVAVLHIGAYLDNAYATVVCDGIQVAAQQMLGLDAHESSTQSYRTHIETLEHSRMCSRDQLPATAWESPEPTSEDVSFDPELSHSDKQVRGSSKSLPGMKPETLAEADSMSWVHYPLWRLDGKMSLGGGSQTCAESTPPSCMAAHDVESTSAQVLRVRMPGVADVIRAFGGARPRSQFTLNACDTHVVEVVCRALATLASSLEEAQRPTTLILTGARTERLAALLAAKMPLMQVVRAPHHAPWLGAHVHRSLDLLSES